MEKSGAQLLSRDPRRRAEETIALAADLPIHAPASFLSLVAG
jgi:hypothetical protein